MRRSRHRRPPPPPPPTFRANERIRVPQVRLIDATGTMIGVVDTPAALRAAEEAGLDLVEVSPKAEPPVCRILDYGSFKYQIEKEDRARKAKQKATELKGVRLSLRIGKHDMTIRLTQAREFLADNQKVKIELPLRGREKAHGDQARVVLNEFVAELGDSVKVEQPTSWQAGRLSIIVAPKNS